MSNEEIINSLEPGTTVKITDGVTGTEVTGDVLETQKAGYGYDPKVILGRPGKTRCLSVYVHENDTVEIVKHVQPEEPTAFGALVRSNGVRYVRTFNGPVPPARLTTVYPWAPEKSRDTPISRNQTWAELKLSNLEVLNEDPFARTSPDKTTDDDSPR